MKAALYCRLSEEDKNKVSISDVSESIQNQRALLEGYVIANNWEIYDVYSDDDWSGLDEDRPEWNRLLKDAEDGKFNVVICKSQSRFTREMEAVEKYLHKKFIEWNIRFIGLVDNADTFNKGNKKQRQIVGLTNEWFCEDISENVKAAFDVKRKLGKFIGSFAAYGYAKDPADNNKLIIDEEAAKIVRQIYAWYLEGYGAQRITQELNKRKIPNPTFYKRKLGLNYKKSFNCSMLWNRLTVKRILQNPSYAGHMAQGKIKKLSYKSKKYINIPKQKWIIVKNTHEAIIQEEVFLEVQRRFKSRQKSTKKGQTHIFATKVKCLDCGGSMQKGITSKDRGEYPFLRCKLYLKTPKENKLCTSHYIKLNDLEKIVSKRLKEYINDYLDEDNAASILHAESEINNKIKDFRKELNRVNMYLQEQTQILESLYVDKVKGIISEEVFIDFNKKFMLEKGVYEQKREYINMQIKEISNKADNIDEWVKTVRKYKDFDKLTHEMVNDLIDYIEIGERNKVTDQQTIKIHWLF